MRVVKLCDHSFNISLGSLCFAKFIKPSGRSILANTVFDTTRSDKKSSVSYRNKKVTLLRKCDKFSSTRFKVKKRRCNPLKSMYESWDS